MTDINELIAEMRAGLEGVTPGKWKYVSDPHFDSGLVYTSVQPVVVDEEAMKPLAMANGEYHVCRMSHTAAQWRFSYHRKNAAHIARCNPSNIAALLDTLTALKRENEELREALGKVTGSRIAEDIRDLVAGWNGEGRPEEERFGRHPDALGANIPTTCGDVYALDEALVAARAALDGRG